MYQKQSLKPSVIDDIPTPPVAEKMETCSESSADRRARI